MAACCKSVKRAFVNFRLKSCCCVTSVRIGIYIIAYCKVLVSLISLLSEGRFSPIANGVKNLLSSESSAVPNLANITVIFFNVLLLVAVNKKFTVLLRVFIYYCIAKVAVMAAVIWPIIYANEESGLTIIIITVVSILFQFYIMLLVRSVIVCINEEIAELNGKAPVQIIFNSSSKEAQSGQTEEASVVIHMTADLKPTEEKSNQVDEHIETPDRTPNDV